MSQIRVNVRSSKVGKIRREVRDGREKIIVPSATLPDNIVMNGVLYPADEIEASYRSLEGTPAPLGHPTLNGKFCPANHTEAFIRNGIGAYNENVRRKDGRVWLDKVIDVEFANSTPKGRELIEALEKGDPIHTSTGLICRLDNTGGKKVARSILWDHDAILIGEDGAATPEQGVGLLVNQRAVGEDGEEVEVMNSSIEEAERELDWAVDHAARAAERVARIPLLERLKALVLGEVARGEGETVSNNQEDGTMAVTDEQFKALKDKVDSLANSMDKIGETIANAVTPILKPVVDAQEALANAAKEADEAEKADLVKTLVNAGWDEDAASELSLASLRKQKAKIDTPARRAAPLSNAFAPKTNSDTKSQFKLQE